VIASVTGQVLEVRPEGVVVSLGGLGILVLCGPDIIAGAHTGQLVSLFTSLVVREDSLTLFGFPDADSRDLFDTVQSVSGFGPKLAFAVLSSLPAGELRRAIVQEDVARLTATPGVGAKGAQRLILELRDRVGPVAEGNVTGSWQPQVVAALVGLGWSSREAAGAVAQLGDAADREVSDLLRAALALLRPA
jgi:Holliday junction DNA helicase RuvA